MVVGLAVLVLGMAAFVLKWPTWYRGQADRHNVVSSVGLAMIWVGIGRLVLARSRVVGVAAAAALGVVLVAANVTFQADWSRAATEARRVVQAIDCQERAGRAGPFVVGPEVPTPGGVRPIHTFYARDAAVVVAGRPLPVSFADSPAAWARVDPASRLTWAELASAPPCDR